MQFSLPYNVAQSKNNGINSVEQMLSKLEFESALNELASTLTNHVSAAGQWTVKGFIDVFKNVYAISSDTKIISKILKIHLFPKILAFAERHGFAVVLAEHQNYYPDISFVCKDNESLKFAVDFKTTYRNPQKPWLYQNKVRRFKENHFS